MSLQTMFCGQQEFHFESASTSAPENSAISSKAETSIKQIDESDAEALSSNAVVPQLLVRRPCVTEVLQLHCITMWRLDA